MPEAIKENVLGSWKTTLSGAIPGIIILLNEGRAFLDGSSAPDFNNIIMAISIILGFAAAKEK
jgi:hypothetical protein